MSLKKIILSPVKVDRSLERWLKPKRGIIQGEVRRHMLSNKPRTYSDPTKHVQLINIEVIYNSILRMRL